MREGNLEPPKQAVGTKGPDGKQVFVPAGGAAYLAGALNSLRQSHANTVTVAAGDLIGASPITSSLFLDEPTILVMNQLGLDLASSGNHEFDRGTAELTRTQAGG